MKKYNILVVDDSAFMRRIITQKLEEEPTFSVIGIARDGIEAIEKIHRLKPDLVTMDVEMPRMNGIEALEKIMQEFSVPVVMLSSRTKEGAKDTIQALEMGAVDFFLKEKLINSDVESRSVQEFFMRLKGILQTKSATNSSVVSRPKQVVDKVISPPQPVTETKKMNPRKIELVFIGCSTGGPSALQSILPFFPKDFPVPVVVAQHMPLGFTKPLADRFNSLCSLKVDELQEGQALQAGNIYIAPAGYQTLFERTVDGRVVFKVDKEATIKALYRPCIDVSLTSAAPIFKDRLLSIILTGMGVDGMQGCGQVKKNNGTVFVEAEQTCVVYGMPKAVKEAGFADGQYPLPQIVHEILSFVKR